jgi:hypothetical protein
VVALPACGGDDDEGSSPAVTAAEQPQQKPAAPAGSSDGSTSSEPEPPANPPATGSIQRRLAPFRDCLTRRGPELPPLDGSGARQRALEDPAKVRALRQTAAACIPELPPKMRESAERLRRRFERRSG